MIIRLRHFSNCLHLTLADTLEKMAKSANKMSREVMNCGSCRGGCHVFYVDGLSYQYVKDKGINKR